MSYLDTVGEKSRNPMLIQFYLYQVLQMWLQATKMTTTFGDGCVYFFEHVSCVTANS
jgi:hypothetical protein